MTDVKFTIIYDTYCGWCYGAAPLFDALLETGAQVEVFHRHLFAGANAPKMKDGKGEYILEMDAHIAALTGQTFSAAYTNNVVRSPIEVLDSKYSALAAALVHERGAKKEFALRKRLEHQRFIQGKSAQDKQAVIQALIAEGVEPEIANNLDSSVNTEKAENLALHARSLMASTGAKGVPTLLKVKDGQSEVINHSLFYGQPELLRSVVTQSDKLIPTL